MHMWPGARHTFFSIQLYAISAITGKRMLCDLVFNASTHAPTLVCEAQQVHRLILANAL